MEFCFEAVVEVAKRLFQSVEYTINFWWPWEFPYGRSLDDNGCVADCCASIRFYVIKKSSHV